VPELPFSDRHPRLWRAFTVSHAVAYRLSGGRVGRRIGEAPVLLLEHLGRRSGRWHTSPLLYMRDGDDLVVVASAGGSPRDPQWWLNLEAYPQARVRIGGRRREVVAHRASEDEKRAMWGRLLESWPDFETYERRTERDIPVVVLAPR
jgi:F420H(2)-dependent quinone reductase